MLVLLGLREYHQNGLYALQADLDRVVLFRRKRVDGRVEEAARRHPPLAWREGNAEAHLGFCNAGEAIRGQPEGLPVLMHELSP